ncbi:30S ribosomal protein S6 [Candidatus Roizmanbacteria bacterium]|nr:30S ribosomal protein S6 [Candidatus Roizmanbacteria bacterium]
MLGLNSMRSYELILITKASLSDALRKKLMTSIKALLGDLKVKDEKELGEKHLAYKIKKETKGFYWDLFLEGEGVPKDFEKKLGEFDKILRHLLIKVKNSKVGRTKASDYGTKPK